MHTLIGFFESRLKCGFDVRNNILVGFQNLDRIEDVAQKNDVFYRFQYISGQCIFGTESYREKSIKTNYTNHIESQA